MNHIGWGFGADFWLYMALVPVLSIWSAWVYNANWHSTLVVVLLHTAFDLCVDTLVVPGPQQRSFNLLEIPGVLAITLLWWSGMQRTEPEGAWPAG